jgi:hypothetical protein
LTWFYGPRSCYSNTRYLYGFLLAFLLAFKETFIKSLIWLGKPFGIRSDSDYPSHAALAWSGFQTIIQQLLPGSGEWDPSRMVKAVEASAGNMDFRQLDREGRALREREKAFRERALMAMFRGAALIGPVLIMTLHLIE